MEDLTTALEVCEDDRLALAIHLAFSCPLRLGEMMGLIGMGNNPMVGASVAVAVAVEEAMK